ncbi:signal peptidase I [Lacrimispora sphenoides]|jgi:signal peptidase I|uniref:signal peptidase I n=1 Tax=Lacrimispora sphenoides TaxID=29370 RepID=UPI0008BEBFC4|nr:signal peptidase I [Lacrimispora sphenoides]SET45020.1 signal peptidase I [Lacrimispora sphenoides]
MERLRKKYQPKHAASMDYINRSFWFPLIKSAVIAVAAALIFNMMFGIGVVSGTSMEPALYDEDIIVFWKHSSSYEKGDIVFIKAHGREDYVKRICGIPGDVMGFDDDNGLFLVNGEVQKESFIYEKTYGKTKVDYPLALFENQYFVMGDHRSDSLDSRNYGAVSKEQIHGKAFLIFRGGL